MDVWMKYEVAADPEQCPPEIILGGGGQFRPTHDWHPRSAVVGLAAPRPRQGRGREVPLRRGGGPGHPLQIRGVAERRAGGGPFLDRLNWPLSPFVPPISILLAGG